MEIFRKYLGGSTESDEVVGADIVDKLKYRLEVGTQAMIIFSSVLKTDWEDSDCVCYALEGLYSVMNDEAGEQVEPHELINIPTDLGVQFTEMYMKNTENYQILLSLLDAPESFIRRNAMRLLTVLSINRLKDTQNAVLQCRTGVSKLVDILSDTHEVLRNDVILLLTELTKANANIQKIVAFENAFDWLLKIIYSEGLCDGSVVVEDCLRLLLQLLDGNPSNQVLFVEGNFIQRLSLLFDLYSTDSTQPQLWSAQKVVNAEVAMQVVQTLVAPCNKAQLTRNCQNVVYDCGLLEKLCNIVMVSGVPADVLTKSIYALADSIRGCPRNQEYLANLVTPSEPPQSAVNVLLVSMLNKHQSVVVRVAALYCFQCYLASNHQAQNAIVMTLLPKPNDVPQLGVSAGQLLCGGLFSSDSSAWFSSVALLHCIHDNVQLKEELLRVHLSPKEGAPPVTLFHQCFMWQQQCNHFQTRMGLLQLLCTWFTNCSEAVRCFLNPSSSTGNDRTESVNRSSYLWTLIAEACAVDNDENEALVHGLTTLLVCICVMYNPGNVNGFEKSTLYNALEKRIGIDMILERLSQISKAESFITATKKPQISVQSTDDLIFDYTFTRLFKRLEYEVMHTFQSDSSINGVRSCTSFGNNHQNSKPVDPTITTLSQQKYDEKLARQENEIAMLRNRISVLESELNTCRSTINGNTPTDTKRNNMINEGELQKLTITDNITIQNLEQKCSMLEKERDNLRGEHEDLLLLLNDQDVKIMKLCKLVRELGGHIPNDIGLGNVIDSQVTDNHHNQLSEENTNQSLSTFRTIPSTLPLDTLQCPANFSFTTSELTLSSNSISTSTPSSYCVYNNNDNNNNNNNNLLHTSPPPLLSHTNSAQNVIMSTTTPTTNQYYYPQGYFNAVTQNYPCSQSSNSVIFYSTNNYPIISSNSFNNDHLNSYTNTTIFQ
ncbi:vesicle docking protein P115, putative [Schistosoma mansoni]|uniref:vesicle docking protein P115, putative n=1 Tax=Schistosoma mansoni TaxID=6183 RepID=UPI00022C8642|nr:vesicle docking protein P115, putative [Schistosoma mansoni]|eukprot:XP_018645827.1 vesicle docking protein P115, putative [Schistosoma mansoni]